MGNDQVGLVDLVVAGEQDVDVERAGPPPLAGDPPRLVLQTLGHLEQLAGRAIRFDGDDRVEVLGLLGPADGVRLVDGRDRHDGDAVGGGEPVDRCLQGAGPVADVRTEPEVRPPHGWTAPRADRVGANERVGIEAGEVVVDSSAQVLGRGHVGPDEDVADDCPLRTVVDPHNHGVSVGAGALALTLVGLLDCDDEPVSSPHGYRSMRTATWSTIARTGGCSFRTVTVAAFTRGSAPHTSAIRVARRSSKW